MNILVNNWNARDLSTETYIRTELFSGQRLNSQLCDASQLMFNNRNSYN